MSGSVNKVIAFLQKVDFKGLDSTQCWSWTGAGKGNGYGQTSHEGQSMGAHRKAYLLFCGDIPEGMDVCHTCDNRWCVNPDHLYVASRLENMAQCVARGRASGGCRKHLKEHTIQEIVRRLNAGTPPRRVAEQMDVNYGTITAIRAGRSYSPRSR